ncbi:uncharacterized protein LOC110015130 [Oryzias latipes]
MDKFNHSPHTSHPEGHLFGMGRRAGPGNWPEYNGRTKKMKKFPPTPSLRPHPLVEPLPSPEPHPLPEPRSRQDPHSGPESHPLPAPRSSQDPHSGPEFHPLPEPRSRQDPHSGPERHLYGMGRRAGPGNWPEYNGRTNFCYGGSWPWPVQRRRDAASDKSMAQNNPPPRSRPLVWHSATNGAKEARRVASENQGEK